MILLYHAVVEDTAPPERWSIGQAIPVGALERQLAWLKMHRTVAPLGECLEKGSNGRRRKAVALTFDDGLASAFANVLPILRRYELPATFFVSTGHLDGGQLLWFAYLNALCFESEHREVVVDSRVLPLGNLTERKRARWILGALARASGDPAGFGDALAAAYPLSPGLLAEYGGMTREQVRLASSDLLEVGSHSVTHPYLGEQSAEDQAREMIESKRTLESLTGRVVRYFAYPAGDYNRETLALVKSAGYEAAFATISKRLGSDEGLEVDRIGIYSVSFLKFELKAFGVANLARRLGMQVG